VSALQILRNCHQYSRRLLRVMTGNDIFIPAQIKVRKLRLGNARASWCLCPAGVSSKSVVYSFGVGNDLSFDLELTKQLGVRVHAFDPTPRSIEWVRSQLLPESIIFHSWGVAAHDGIARFNAPENPHHVSYSTFPSATETSSSLDAPVYRIATIMQMLGHDRIDLLKMDIEGSEYEVIHDLLASHIYVDQLLVEFHHRWRGIGIKQTQQAIKDLNYAGYRIFHVSASGEEYSLRLSRSSV
jgi:FkbM family methyltransferase